jgi:hypothetical protein
MLCSQYLVIQFSSWCFSYAWRGWAVQTEFNMVSLAEDQMKERRGIEQCLFVHRAFGVLRNEREANREKDSKER